MLHTNCPHTWLSTDRNEIGSHDNVTNWLNAQNIIWLAGLDNEGVGGLTCHQRGAITTYVLIIQFSICNSKEYLQTKDRWLFFRVLSLFPQFPWGSLGKQKFYRSFKFIHTEIGFGCSNTTKLWKNNFSRDPFYFIAAIRSNHYLISHWSDHLYGS